MGNQTAHLNRKTGWCLFKSHCPRGLELAPSLCGQNPHREIPLRCGNWLDLCPKWFRNERAQEIPEHFGRNPCSRCLATYCCKGGHRNFMSLFSIWAWFQGKRLGQHTEFFAPFHHNFGEHDSLVVELEIFAYRRETPPKFFRDKGTTLSFDLIPKYLIHGCRWLPHWWLHPLGHREGELSKMLQCCTISGVTYRKALQKSRG